MDIIPEKCPHCGSSNISCSVRVDQTADAGRIGLSYKTKFLLAGVEPFYADLCEDCGTVVRLYVKSLGHKWYTK